jgi:hypothetical protein
MALHAGFHRFLIRGRTLALRQRSLRYYTKSKRYVEEASLIHIMQYTGYCSTLNSND